MTTTRPERSIALTGIFLLGTLAAVAGVVALRDTTIGGSVPGALRAISSQLSTTGPAVLAVSAVLAANVLAGAVLMRAMRGMPYESVLDAIVFGFSGAVLLDVVFLGVLGSVGLFNAPVLAVALVGIDVLGLLRYRPLMGPSTEPKKNRLPAGFWVFVVVAWCAPLVLTLASPVVPFRDVLHNHVAPVEFVRTYGWFPRLFTSPAAETGPTRQILGYVGVLATVAKLTGFRAVLATAAFAAPLTALFAMVTYRIAETRVRLGAGMWALAVMPLTFAFLRLPDSRGTVVAGVVGLTSFLPLPSLSTQRRVLARSALLAAALYVHPLLGGIAVTSHGLLALWLNYRDERNSDFPVWSVAGALVFATPQLLVVAGIDAPSWIVLLAAPAGVLVAFTTANIRLPLRQLGVVLSVLGVAAFLLGVSIAGTRALRIVADDAALFPLIALGFGVFLFAERDRSVRIYLAAPVVAGLLVQLVATFFPSNTIFWNSTRDEVIGKSGQNWIPAFLVLGTAGALQWAWHRLPRSVYLVLVTAFVFTAAFPVRQGTVDIEEARQRAISESLSISIRKAEMGAWSGWPDQRELIGEPEKQIVAAFRAEQSAGRMTHDTRTLQIAESQQTWVSVPIAAFAGAYVTHLSKVPEVSGHTMGGRLRGYAELKDLLGPEFAYVLLEPAGVPAELRTDILDAGYKSIFRTVRGEIFRRPS